VAYREQPDSMTSITETTSKQTIRIGHSPDPDDAFMWYPIARSINGQPVTPKIDTHPYDFTHVLEDIQSLNDRSERGDLEITAISIHQYPYVAQQYALTSCGSSMGDNYGPMVVVPDHSPIRTPDDLKGIKIAIPGRRTTAFLALSLMLGTESFECETVEFDQIISAVAQGRYEAGLIIHEGQLTYANTGLRCVVDLGQWWTQTRNLPLPLGGNVIRRDLGDQMRPICRILLNSIEYALEHRQEAIEYALNFARDMGSELADEFVGMYVNQWTLDYGPQGRQAVRQLLLEAAQAGLTPHCPDIDFIDPA